MSPPIRYDLLLVGGSASNLILAHRLLDLAAKSGLPLTVALVEKSAQFGAHIVSGALTKTHVLEKVFPNFKTNGFPIEGYVTHSHLSVLGSEERWDLPHAIVPKGFRKEGHAILTLSHAIRWLAEQLQAKAKALTNVVLDVFPGFAAQEILYAGERVAGVRVSASGDVYEDAIFAEFTCFGDKGFLSKDLVERFALRPNPQLWSVGIKEVWEVDLDCQGVVWHTLGYPILDGTFSGGFVYGLGHKKLAIGLVISLDSKNPNLNPQLRLQQFKAHPWIQELIQGGRLLKYGAAVIPEGGYYSLPTRFGVEGALLLGDALGVLDAASLSGLDKSMETGYIAAELLHGAFVDRNFEGLAERYKRAVMDGFIGQELYASRHFRRAFLENDRLLGEYLPAVCQSVDQGHPWLGSLKFGLGKPIQRSTDTFQALGLILGRISGDKIFRYTPCHENIEPTFTQPAVAVSTQARPETILSRPDAVFFAAPRYHEGNRHIEEFDPQTCRRCIAIYDRLGKPTPCIADCTAEVHRIDEAVGVRVHGMSLENCIQCRTCEIVCPSVNLRVNPTYEGSGPDFYGL
ncbi:electron transfer flavoprotein [Gloeobacter morelensis]|uniref:Electron transfer flavoprotein-ubiquinone oxidoreductase n=1 Tax=Gloeobacter morelensis MG652769 TaxID=2781736 RepID=A0ABY3PKU3_9CYAN|nr:electron transfer flavoprotein [Gloeobacter morelensis]UFP94238.1 electron transfer flavoprotein [Gloeobacter morelensis MG652769]